MNGIKKIDAFKLVKFEEDHPNEIIVLKFTAEWCPPCKKMSEILEEEKPWSRTPSYWFEVDIDDPKNEYLVRKFKIRGVPSIFLTFNSSIKKKLIGADPAKIDKFLQNVEKFHKRLVKDGK